MKAGQTFPRDQLIKCIISASPGYKKDKVYKIELHEGKLGIWADDGYFDQTKNLVSKFEAIDETAISKGQRKNISTVDS